MWEYLIPAIILLIILVLYFSPNYLPKLEVTAAGPFDLAKESTLVEADAAGSFVADPAASFQTFVYLNPLMRTGSYGGCGTNPNQPSCADGTFGPCPCDARTGDCATSCRHTGYLPMLNMCGLATIEILNVPDASRQGKAMVQMTVKTETPALTAGVSQSQKYIETIPLPPIQFQKWTMITVARDGRRFDVYYNDKIVASQKTLNMPISKVIDSNLRGIVSGAEGLLGTMSNTTLFKKRLTVMDVQNKYSALADTRGQPYLISTQPTTLQDWLVPNAGSASMSGIVPTFSTPTLPTIDLTFGICPKGSCLEGPTVRPANPIYDWASSYA